MSSTMLRAGEDYLEAILCLERESGLSGARTTDIARKLEVTKPSVNKAMKILSEQGYITHENYGFIYLTEKGRIKANQVLNRHNTLTLFFRDILGVDPDQAEKDACLIEHYISSESMEKLRAFVEEERSKEI